MPNRGEGQETSSAEHDRRLVALTKALSGLREPARTFAAAARPVLAEPPPGMPDGLIRNLQHLLEWCELQGPATDRAIREVVELVGTGLDDGEH